MKGLRLFASVMKKEVDFIKLQWIQFSEENLINCRFSCLLALISEHLLQLSDVRTTLNVYDGLTPSESIIKNKVNILYFGQIVSEIDVEQLKLTRIVFYYVNVWFRNCSINNKQEEIHAME